MLIASKIEDRLEIAWFGPFSPTLIPRTSSVSNIHFVECAELPQSMIKPVIGTLLNSASFVRYLTIFSVSW
jgi:hypothetical protein